jgi:membrane protease YdiL (CAAX protease family)
VLDVGEHQHTPSPPPPDAVPWGLPEAVGAVILAFVIYFIGSVALAVILDGFVAGGTGKHGLEFGMLGYQFLVLGTVVSAFLILKRSRSNVSALGFRNPGVQVLLAAMVSVIPIFVGVSVLYFLFSTLLPGYHLHGNAKELLQGTSGHLASGEKVALFIFAAIEAPVTEELLFRGIMFQGLRNAFTPKLRPMWATATAAATSGLLFGFLHLQPQTLPILVFLGIVLAYVFHRARSLYASMVVHGIINGLAVLSLLQSS